MAEELILNRYRPLEEAGSGGYGTVVVAWDPRIQRRVAIKQLQLDPDLVPAPTEEGIAYDMGDIPGLEEARTAALLSDPNIVGILDFELEENIAYLIMEYVDGCTLTQLMHDYPDEVTLDIVGAVFASVAHALQVAHENQVLHLDIKPDNVLINRQGEVKVTDFGLARLSNPDGFDKAAGGTIGYMPLEQMRLQQLDARCDEWALAALAYEMISRGNPFLAPDLKSAEAAIEDAELVLPSLCLEGLDAQADDVLFYALSPDREERYASVADFAEELQPYLGNPKTGKKQLARLVGAATDEEDVVEEGAAVATAVRWGNSIGKRVAVRIWASLNNLVLAAVGLSCMEPWIGDYRSAGFWVGMAIVLAGSLVLPHLGALFAVVAFSLALISQGAYVAGAVLLLAGALWWFFSGKASSRGACATMSVVPLGIFGLGAVAPVLCGYFLKVKDAAISCAFAALLSLALIGSGASTLVNWDILELWGNAELAVRNSLAFEAAGALLANPALWIDAASWILAGVILALFCSRENRVLGFIGALLSGLLLVAAAFAHTWFASGGFSLVPDALDFIRCLVPLLVGGVLCIYGIPERNR